MLVAVDLSSTFAVSENCVPATFDGTSVTNVLLLTSFTVTLVPLVEITALSANPTRLPSLSRVNSACTSLPSAYMPPFVAAVAIPSIFANSALLHVIFMVFELPLSFVINTILLPA